MTEEEWLTRNEPGPMLKSLEGKASLRKLRLFTCGCCRALWDAAWPQRCTEVVRDAERFADDLISYATLNQSRSRACQSAQNVIRRTMRSGMGHAARDHHGSILTFASDTALGNRYLEQRLTVTFPAVSYLHDESLIEIMPSILRDIFGNPFRPIVADSAWLTPTVQAIADAIYQDRAFDRLPILADTLEEAGCTNADVLLHCRQPGEHVRGCWVVDLVLGKE